MKTKPKLFNERLLITPLLLTLILLVFDVNFTPVKATEWVEITPVNTARSRTALIYSEKNNKFYLIGGESAGGKFDSPIEEYDPISRTWTDKSTLIEGVNNIGAAEVNGKIYIPGGWRFAPRTELQVYDPLIDKVILETPLPKPSFAQAVVSLGHNVHVLGGRGIDGYTNDHLIYDTVMKVWSEAASVPFEDYSPTAVTDGKYIYYIGNELSDITYMERYDPVTDSWETQPAMQTRRGGLKAIFDGSIILAVGGNWTEYLTSTELFDGSNWIAGNDVLFATRSFGLAFGDGYTMKATGWNSENFVPFVEINDQLFANSFDTGFEVQR